MNASVYRRPPSAARSPGLYWASAGRLKTSEPSFVEGRRRLLSAWAFRMGFAARFDEYRASGFLKVAPGDVELSYFAADFAHIASTAWALRFPVEAEELPHIVALNLGGVVGRVGARLSNLETKCVTPDFFKRLTERRAALLSRGVVSTSRASSSSSSSRAPPVPSSATSANASSDEENDADDPGAPRRIAFLVIRTRVIPVPRLRNAACLSGATGPYPVPGSACADRKDQPESRVVVVAPQPAGSL